MIDVSELMTDPELSRTLTVRRPRSGAFVNEGEFTASYDQDLVTGIVQSPKASDMEFLPEGTRIEDTISVWSAEELRGADGVRQEPDVLLVDGLYYKIIASQPRPDGGYFKAFAQRYTPS